MTVERDHAPAVLDTDRHRFGAENRAELRHLHTVTEDRREVTGRRVVAVGGESVRVHEMRMERAELPCPGVHPIGELRHRPRQALGDDHAGVIRGVEQDRVDEILEIQPLPREQVHLARCRLAGFRTRREASPELVTLERKNRRHDFRRARRR